MPEKPSARTALSGRIIAAAAALFRNKGYKGATISDISHACRISRKTLYDIFASKEDILNVVLWRELSAVTGRLYGDDPGIPSEIRLMELCRHIFEEMADPRGDTFFWALFSSEPALQRAAFVLLGAVIGGLYEKGREEGVFKAAEPSFAADFVIACIKAARTCATGKDRYRLFNESLVMIASGLTGSHVTLEFRGFRKDYYRILGVTTDAAPDDIKQAYRASAKQYHPDSNRAGDDQSEVYHDIRKAYETLIDPEQRRVYDRFLTTPLSIRSGHYAYEFDI